MQKELGATPDSHHAQIRSATEMLESLNEYLRLYGGEETRKDMETELSKTKLEYAEKLEIVNQKLNHMKLKETNLKERLQNSE